MIDPWLQDLLACPYDGTRLRRRENELACEQDHSFPVIDGVPILLRHDAPRSHPAVAKTLSEVRENRIDELRLAAPFDEIDPVVQVVVAATCGRLYTPLVGKLTRYPIPVSRLPEGGGRSLLDLGCNWGRWTFSAARRGFRAIGLDPDLGPVLAARRIAHQLGLTPQFVVGSADALPFRSSVIDTVFSYSVLQHFSKPGVEATLGEVGRVLRRGGLASIQMPNGHSLLGFYRAVKYPRTSGFDVRNWTPAELVELFTRQIGRSELTVDGFFGLGIQPDDIDIMPLRYKAVIASSEVLRFLSTRIPLLTRVADSLYVNSRKP